MRVGPGKRHGSGADRFRRRRRLPALFGATRTRSLRRRQLELADLRISARAIQGAVRIVEMIDELARSASKGYPCLRCGLVDECDYFAPAALGSFQNGLIRWIFLSAAS